MPSQCARPAPSPSSWGSAPQPLTEAAAFDDTSFMRLALELGTHGAPAPNPHVGAVVVRDGRVVGVGYHERAGTAHAEALALERAGTRARGATLYVTLEPCNHHGRTPPCVDAILASGVRRVVIGCPDPNPHVAGGGAAALRSAGIEVVDGPCRREAAALIEPWRAMLAPARKSAG
ncbi:MAG TPA: bifunctional diaminohydroxyphosphoribosylaminopyrimidine deaminase/5-amino-6-(5-phosphoribosylamino)uracil reductase RibD [Polyangiaceae bacterium]|nr:bifunctional diaminohydroxyphosphoribosylaminopyrimidine deaminase/5-amino-6-(5-phosphoribosylamino)uracil reductase RibD [Polyangiaceae bacterium]